MKFFKSILAYSINLFGFLSNRVDVKALELKEKTDNEINVPVLRAQFEQKANDTLDQVYEQVTKLLTEIKLTKTQIDTDQIKLQKTAIEINRLEDELKTVNIESLSNLEKMNHEFALKNMRLEAKTLLNDIQFNQNNLVQTEKAVEQMTLHYHENRYKARTILSQLQNLENRLHIVESKQSIEKIDLGVNNYTLIDIVKIVDGKEAAFEARNYADTILLREGSKSVTDLRIEQAENQAVENDLNEYLLKVREDKDVKLIAS